jgi:GLPGLI family protein
MIRFFQQIAIILALLVTTMLQAQSFQGRVYYQSKIKMKEDSKSKMDSMKMAPDQKKMIMDMIKKAMNKTYILDFNKTTSIFKEDEKLESPNSTGFSVKMSSNTIYKDISSKKYIEQSEHFGKVFLVTDDLEKINWKLEKESKKIGNYTVFKATTMVEKKERPSRKPKQEIKKDSILDKQPKMEKLTVWYTPEIPVSNGPELYQGLPGLILEANVGRTQILATKIVLNPKEKVEIIPPVKGKVVTQKEYDKIMEKKFKEMIEMRRNGRKKTGNSRSRHIFIGG